MPIGGKVVEVNTALQSDPALVNKDPYGAGWMLKIEPTNLAEMDQLLDSKSYGKTIGEE